MATYTTLRKGSKGDEVKKLQTSLGFTGKDVDGIFGDKTLSAVKDYQKNNGLTVDGIVGKNTWGSLNKASTTAPSTTAPKDTSFKYEDFKPSSFEKSDTLKGTGTKIDELMSQNPGAFEYSWQNQLDDIYNKIMNREEFSYDLNGDALYQQYKDQYATQGQMAMMDTMGQAQAMTGGYGNSYAQSVGQQTYQGYLQQLNDKVPELYQLARDQYNQEEQGLYNQAALLAQQKEQDYGMYRDAVSDRYTELGLLGDQYDRMYNEEYGTWSDMTSIAKDNHTNRQNYEYQAEQNAIENAWRQKEFDEGVRQFNKSLAASQSKTETPKALSVDDHDKVIAQLQAYHDVGDNTKLAGYLDSLVAAGTISEQYADTLYETYYAKVAGPNPAPNFAANGYKFDFN